MQNVTLKEHNVPVYESFEQALEKENLALLNSCPGSGKSYILLKFLQDHPGNALVVCPKNSIRDEWEKAGEEYGASVRTATYHLLGRLDEAGLKNLADGYDYIVFDEAHHMGAVTWQESITALRKACPDKKYIGLTATPVRYTDGMRDVGSEFFAGNIVNGTSQFEAVEKGILPGYKYVCALFGLSEETRRLKEKDMDDVVYEKIRHLENCAENRNGIYEAFDQYMPEGNRKGIVFVDRIENIPSSVEIMKGYYGNDMPYFIINSGISWSNNMRTLHKFEETESGWIFVVDMLNEGLHISGVNTIVMFRKTISPNVFIQQLGRSQAAGASEAVIFDFVGNRKNLMAMGFVPIREGNGTKMQYSADPRIIIDCIETDAVKLLDEIENMLSGWRLWTDEEDNVLIERYSEIGPKGCAELLGRTPRACAKRAQRLDLVQKDKSKAWTEWTPEEDEFILANYAECGAKYCAEHLPERSEDACRKRAEELIGICFKNRLWTEEEDDVMRMGYPIYGLDWCVERLPERSRQACKRRAKILGLRRCK